MKKNLLIAFIAINSLLHAQTPRTSLYEEFTGETCPPCASTNPGLNALLLSPINQNRIIPIKWQVPIPFAPTNSWSLYQTNKTEIDWRYQPASFGGYGYPSQNNSSSAITDGISSAPQGVLDGQHQWVFGAASDHPANLNNNVISTAVSFTSAFAIDMRHEFNTTQSAVIVTVNITASANFTATGALVFRCVMLERVIQFSVQPGSNGEKVFEDVAIKSFPTIQAGTPMSSTWSPSQTQTFILNCIIPSYIRKKEEISMVGFIQDDGNRKVAQAGRSKATFDAKALKVSLGPVCSSTIAPVISFMNLGLNALSNVTITPFIDGVAQANTTWSGNLSTGATATVQLNAVTTPAAYGPHVFSYSISAINGTDFYPQNNSVETPFVIASSSSFDQVKEGFLLPAFPPAGWTKLNDNNGIGWTRTTNAGAYFEAPMQAAEYDFFLNTEIGDIDELYLTPTDLRGANAPELEFDYAYAQRNSNSNDKLEVKVSDDCGASWATVFNKSGALLATAPASVNFYVPNANDAGHWVTEQLTLTGFNKNNVLVKFVTTNGNGNNLYLDNVNLFQRSTLGFNKPAKTTSLLNVYPNPANEAVVVSSKNIKEPYTITMLNVLGQDVYTLNNSSQTQIIDLKGMPAGVYTVVLTGKDVVLTKKVSVLK